MKREDKVIWIDENGNKLGVVTRTQAHTQGLLHQISVVYLINEKREVLVQQRADNGKYDHS
ncbi:isopentenyl-diphosphate delta-isomerase, partial [Candidatus Daviesbacteria bacterium]|nr:isopentenyl-diphosphate delta-isomerase [Candidatus Daviesbacteria bacterium]